VVGREFLLFVMGFLGRPKDLQVTPRKGQWTDVGKGAKLVEHGRRAGSLSPRKGQAPELAGPDGAAAGVPPPSRMATGATAPGTGIGSRGGTGAFLYGGESLEARAEARSRAEMGSRAGSGALGTGRFMYGDTTMEERAEARAQSRGGSASGAASAAQTNPSPAAPISVGIMGPSRFGPSASTLFKQRSTVPIVVVPSMRSVQQSQAMADFAALKPDTPTYQENFIHRRANLKCTHGHLGRYAEEALLSGYEPFETRKNGGGQGVGWK